MVEFEAPIILEPEPELKPELKFEPKMKPSPSPSLVISSETDTFWKLVFLRNTRNIHLNNTDKYLLPDYPISPENLEIIKSYRQMLRDFINLNKDLILAGEDIKVPVIPIF